MATKKEVAEVNKNEVVTAEYALPAEFAADAGQGLENVDKDSVAIPFLVILQKISPQVEETDPKFIEGAKANMFLNTVTEECMDGKEGVSILPVMFQRKFLHWGARGTENSGFKGEYTVEEAAAMRDSGKVVEHEGKLYFPNKDGEIDEKRCDKLVDTRNHFSLLVNADGSVTPILLSLASTQIKKSKQLIAMLGQVKVKAANGQSVTPPTWVNSIRLSTVLESNDKGSWYGIRVSREGFDPDPEHYRAAKAFYDLVRSGAAEVNYDSVAPVGDAETSATGDGPEKF